MEIDTPASKERADVQVHAGPAGSDVIQTRDFAVVVVNDDKYLFTQVTPNQYVV